MKAKGARICPLLLAGLLPLAVQAEPPFVGGAGLDSCGKWLETKSNLAAHYQDVNWVLGYVSGINWASAVAAAPQARPVDIPAVTAFVDHYCTANPLHTILQAAGALVQETGGPKADHQWKW